MYVFAGSDVATSERPYQAYPNITANMDILGPVVLNTDDVWAINFGQKKKCMAMQGRSHVALSPKDLLHNRRGKM